CRVAGVRPTPNPLVQTPSAGPTPAPTSRTHHSHRPSHPPKARPPARPPLAAAAANFVGALQAGVQTGEISPQAGQNMFNQLQQLLFQPPDRSSEQIQQQYSQLVQVYDHYQEHGDIP